MRSGAARVSVIRRARAVPVSKHGITLATFVVILAVLVVLDVMAGRVDPGRFLMHGLVLLGLILIMVLDQCRGPPVAPCPAPPP
jgi:predicted anti-sigma-YlaC factor YlaD